MKRIYLAGPDVFLPDSKPIFDELKRLAALYDLEAISPLGFNTEGTASAAQIYTNNIKLIKSCDAVVANLQPFRGLVEPDSGTVFETGFAIALGKPVAGYSKHTHLTYLQKVIESIGCKIVNGKKCDIFDGHLVEDFGLPMNLMLSCSTPVFEKSQNAFEWISAKLHTKHN